MTATLLGCDRPLAEAYDCALVDLDGVTYLGHRPIAWASDSLVAARARGLRVVFVTNNASRSPAVVAEQLTSLGIPSGPGDVMTACQAAAGLLATRLPVGAKVLVVGADALRDAVRERGFAVVDSADDEPRAVAQGWGPLVGWAQLAEAAYAIERGAWHVASNLDRSLPQARGFAPGNGALVAAVQSATGVVPDSAGKPEPTMYRLGVERVGGKRPLVVGDRLDTDLGGARAAGYAGLHVLTGVSSARDAVLADASFRPSFIGADLRALLAAHPAPQTAADGWWTCRGAAARVCDGALEVVDGAAASGDAGFDGLDVVRAACAAVWAAADEGHPVDSARVPDFPVG
ncbi:MAG: HAD hydrolase-like protein [Micrococcales bacterium]|nr:HAD hydrolase-like protein [Micrococcales bacterium]